MNSKEEFLRALGELSQRFGITIGGCGCCGSPFLRERDDDDLRRGRYFVSDDSDDDLTWKVPLPPLATGATLVDSDGSEIAWPHHLRALWAEAYDKSPGSAAARRVEVIAGPDEDGTVLLRVDDSWVVRL